MKRFYLIFLLLLLALPVNAANIQGVMGGGVTGDVTPPLIQTVTISGATGKVLTIHFDEAVDVVTGGGFTIQPTVGSALTPTYVSGTGTTDIVYSLPNAVYTGEAFTYDYGTIANDIEDAANNDLASIGAPISGTNSSDLAAPTSWFTDGLGFESPWDPATSTLGNWGAQSGTPILETTIIKKGSVSQEIPVTAAVTGMTKNCGSTQTEIWVDFWVYLSATVANNSVFKIIDVGASGSTWLEVKADNSVHLRAGAYDQDLGASVTDATWTHMFLHISFTGNNATNVVQYTHSETDARPAWTYDNSTQNLNRTDGRSLFLGNPNNAAVNVYYTDALRSWYGTTEPGEWR